MKKFYIYLAAFLICGLSFGQSTINITTTGGSFPGEKWVSITTGIDGSGTQVWGQGDGTQCNGSGLINQDISIAPGTYYVNCYDQYDDSWDGTLISVTAYGSVIGDNGGVSPSDGADTDLTSSCEGTPEELEASFQIIVPSPPSCLPPSSLNVDSFTADSATISWTAGSTETDWEIVVQADGTGEPGGSGTATTNNLNYTDNTLSANTPYEIWVRADCGANGFSSWVGPVDFQTPVANDDCASALDYTTTFGAIGALGSCPGNTQSLDITDYTDAGEDPTCEFGSDAVAWYTWTATTTSVDFTSGTGQPGLEILDGTCGSFTSLGCLNNTSGRISGLTIGITYYLIIYDEGTFGSTLEWCLEESPSCLEVSDITIDGFTDASVDVNWTASASGETDWEIIVQETATADPGSGDSGTPVNATADSAPPYTFTSLSEQTAYEVFVRANCGGGDYGAWVGPVNFTTPCSAIVPEYNADMSTNVPDSCWDEAGSGDPGTGPSSVGFSSWRQGTSYAFGPSNAMNLYSDFNSEWLLSPSFDLSSGGPFQLEINVAVTDYADGSTDATMGSDDEVQLLISTNGGSTWTNLTTWNVGNEPALNGTEYVEDLTSYSGNVQFAIWANEATDDPEDYDFHVGKFRVAQIPSSSTVDFCNLQFPNSGNINEGGTFTAFAQIFQTGITEAAGQGADIEAWIGYSTTDATTVADFTTGSWTWVPATYNADSGNNDEYQAEIGSALSGGQYYYVSRFRYDGGVFAYGGITPGGSGGNFWDGTSFVSGQLEVLPTPPATVATLNISGCADSDTYSGAYDTSVEGVTWVELIYDGGCSEITVDTDNTTFDTELGLFNAFGNLVANNDDDTGGITPQSLITQSGLPAGTYYLAAARFNVAFSNNFGVTAPSNAQTGTIFINASTPNLPDYVNLQSPGTATITAGNTVNVFAQIFETGNTSGAGAGTNITAEIGISSVDATTVADFETVDWTWTAAPYFGEVGNNDEYSLAIGASLAPGTYYYVSRFSVDGGPFVYGGNTAGPGDGGNFWDGSSNISGVLTVNAKPEPTNHVLTFAAVADSDTEITLTWDDNDGAQPADGFLIVGKTGAATFYAPIDGTDDTDDTDWSDDEAEVKVASGIQTYTFTGLTASTLYEFEIYPYTNFDSDIDYKTDATVPSTSATTDVDPCSIAITTYPFTDDFSADNPCYSFDIISGSTNWARDPSGGSGDILAPNSAPGFMEKNYLSSDALLILPVFDFTALGADGRIRVYLHRDPSAHVNDRYRIHVNTTNSLTGATQIFELFSRTTTAPTVPSEGWYEYTIDIPSSFNTSDSVYIIFQGTTTAGFSSYDLGIDDLVVEAIPIPATYTYNGSWSPSDPNGASTAIDDIVVTSGNAVIASNTNCNNVTVNPNAAITVNSGVTLTVSGEVTLESVSDMYSSLMHDGTVVGTIKYERFVNANEGGNDLIAPPLNGQSWSDFLNEGNNNNDLLTDGDPVNPTYLFGPFDKTTDDWVNYDSNTTATLNSGTGYRAGTDVTAPDTGTTLTFTGTVVTSQVAINILDTGAVYPDWNLIGNPYPAYLDMDAFLNFDIDGAGPNTETNMDILEDLSGIYGYDGSASNGWDVITLANAGSKDMAPGQGFFVAANDTFVADHDITFDPSMRVAGSGDDFIAGRGTNELVFFKLNASTSTKDYTTQFYFNDNASLGLDHGYDAQLWGGFIPSFALYSNLVQDNSGSPIALQALNSLDLVDVVIPLGVNANSGEQLTFTVSETTLPNTIDVYLDDTLNNTTTLLNASDYIITPSSDIFGTGRFFLRFAEQSLSIDEIGFDDIKIYTKPSPRALFIHGVLNGETTAKIFDLHGRLVHSSLLNSNRLLNEIDATDFSDGVYVVTLSNGTQEKTQKVIIR
ncbi:T9SS type A sorting domain-containing protein [Winogradskyella luteola]|uniref:T9SS type A sorting domain-containing protein n=1 Tax=Winogradskyella luteola TaxID=2828330 RepID=A0A9X1F8W7_9FLAO|nr:T9SS type A sorting domain-containing protein [Winogradskyella luteola]MBV7269256.1 T9SS type A sorting domain-containing protein [Winogradskyella luteola]